MFAVRSLIPALLTCLVCLGASDVHAYVLRKDSTGNTVSWKQTAHFVIDERLDVRLSAPGAAAAVERAISTFAGQGIDVALRRGAVGALGFDAQSIEDNRSEILVPDSWDFDENAIAVTVVTVDSRTHQILDADIALNAAHRRFTVISEEGPDEEARQSDDVQNTVTHELGHAMGLAHNPELDHAVMFPSAARGEISKRVLSRDDRQGLAALYPDQVDPNSLGEDPPDSPGALGCSGAGGAPLGWVALALLSLLPRRRGSVWNTMRKLLALLPLLPALALASDDLRPAPRAVFTAEILSSRTLPPTAGSRLLTTELDVAVRACVSGTCPVRTVITVPGGKLGDLEQWVDDALPPEPGALVAVTVPEEPTLQQTGRKRRFARWITLAPPQSPGLELKRSGSTATSPAPLTPAPSR